MASPAATALLRSLDDPSLLKSQALVGGEWVDADDGRVLHVLDKATHERVGSVPDMGGAETRRAAAAAAAAWRAWADVGGEARGAVLRRWHELLLAHEADLARILTAESGKPLAESASELRYGASFVSWFAEEARRAYGEWIPADSPDTQIVVVREPIGVVAAITPWNFPIAMTTRKLAPALAVGCPVVVKPADLTPLSCLALVELACRAGVPPGVLSAVTASAARAAEVGEAMCDDEHVRKLTFTGSTAVGKRLMARAAGTVKKVALELGGNAPLLVFEDADLDVAVRGTMASKFRNAGQTCVCANRILVHEAVYEAFAERLTTAVAALRVGRGTDPGVEIGPLVGARAVAKVEAHVHDAVAKGATVLCGGARRGDLGPHFYAPTVLAGATPDMRLFHEETFGPVAPLFKFATEEEAVRVANDTRYGLAGYVFTRDLGRAWRVAERLEVGIVGVNEGIISTPVAPFGGVKESGLGREGGRHGTEEFTEAKYIRMGMGRG